MKLINLMETLRYLGIHQGRRNLTGLQNQFTILPSIISSGPAVVEYLEYDSKLELRSIHHPQSFTVHEGQWSVNDEEELVRILIPVYGPQYKDTIMETMLVLRQLYLYNLTSDRTRLEDTILLRDSKNHTDQQQEIINRYVCKNLMNGKGEIKGSYYMSEDGTFLLNLQTTRANVLTESGEADVYI